ncbi:hypothetical protein [Novosphingobium percolationis]|uniref:hypothetical protein n=1 Tax=Novosphingobium percolationis TaxID=2871811 RepID=UPI001CD44755|nr:hypothetical protein [Novosphingobium percolationis]
MSNPRMLSWLAAACVGCAVLPVQAHDSAAARDGLVELRQTKLERRGDGIVAEAHVRARRLRTGFLSGHFVLRAKATDGTPSRVVASTPCVAQRWPTHCALVLGGSDLSPEDLVVGFERRLER